MPAGPAWAEGIYSGLARCLQAVMGAGVGERIDAAAGLQTRSPHPDRESIPASSAMVDYRTRFRRAVRQTP